MENKAPFIHTFKVMNKYYFYDVNMHKVVNVSKKTYEFLNDKLDTYDEKTKVIIDNLKSNGYLSSNRVKEIIHPADNTIEDILNKRVKKICLQVTQQCNFRCNYCVYSGGYDNREHSSKIMDIETAKKGIDFLINHSKDSPTINIGFYGGEPLLQFDLIKKCMEYAYEKAEGKKILFSITTNGSLLNEKIVNTLLKYNTSITVSVDGPKDIHDKNRKFAVTGNDTFDIVYKNIKKLIDICPGFKKNLQFSMVIDPTVKLSCINEFIVSENELFNGSSISATIINSLNRKNKLESDESFNVEWEYNKFKYFLFLLGRISESNTSRLINNTNKSLLDYITKSDQSFNHLTENDHHSGPCIPGQVRLFITSEGGFLPCERVNESSNAMHIGDLQYGFNFEKVKKILNVGKLTEEKCKNCFAFRGCYLCAAYADDNESPDGLSKLKKLEGCKNVRYKFDDMLKNYCVLKELGLSSSMIRLIKDN